jgi:hypothetical protein
MFLVSSRHRVRSPACFFFFFRVCAFLTLLSQDYCVNDGVKLVFILVYAAANLVLFLVAYLNYALATAADPGE